MKKIVITLALASVMGIAGTTFAAANPFQDVPANHWAYKAVNDLYTAGVVEGAAGKYMGDATMTRYEMAQIVANAMTKVNKADKATKDIIDKLQVEFADELKNLGTRVTAVEKNQANVKFTGVMASRYSVTDYTASTKAGLASAQYRLRLEGLAKVDDNTTLGMRFVTREPAKALIGNDTWQTYGENGESGTNVNNIDRLFFTTNIGAGKMTIGRQSLYVDSQLITIDSNAFSYDGVKVAWKFGDVGMTANRGRFLKGAGYADTTLNTIADNLDFQSLAASTQIGKANVYLSHADFRNPVRDLEVMKLSQVNVIYNFYDKLSLNALYLSNSASKLVAGLGNKAWAAKIIYGDQVMNKAGAKNIAYQYVDKQANAFINGLSALDSTSGRTSALNVDYTLQNIQYNYAFSKSFNTCLSYTKITPAVAITSDAANTITRLIVNVLF